MIIGSAWLKESNGKKYMSCQVEIPFLGKLHFAMFKIEEDKRTKENSPNYSIVWSATRENRDKPKGQSGEEDDPFATDFGNPNI